MRTEKILTLFTLLAFTISTYAQLKVTSDGKVKISSALQVGNSQYGGPLSKIGILGTSSSGTTNGAYYGILGIADCLNNSHGRNYGVCGMIGFTGGHYGGAGIYGTNYTYWLSNPANIKGDYAGYFDGPVNIRGNLTATNLYVPVDSRISKNISYLNREYRDSKTLDNLLTMNVIEYKMKSRVIENLPNSAKQNVEDQAAYERLKKDENELSSKWHFGIDAKELQKIYPDLVIEGQDGYLAVNYMELIPILVRSIQELKQELDEVKTTKDSILQVHNDLREDNAATDVLSPILQKCILYQNTPNPFSEITTISFSLTEEANNAYIYIFNIQGKMLK